MDADLRRNSNNSSTSNSASTPTTLFSFPPQHTLQQQQQQHQDPTNFQHTQLPVPPPHLTNLQEMLDTTSALDHAHHLQFDNRGAAPMYYPSQPSSTYDEGSPDSLRKASPVNFLRANPGQPPKRLLDLEPRGMHGLDSTGSFDSGKSDYYGGAEAYAANPAAAQFLRSPASDYYPMEATFSAPPSQAPQIHSPAFMKVDEPGDPHGGAGSAYGYTSPPPHPMRHPSALPPPSYAPLDDGYGKIQMPPVQTTLPTAIPQHPHPPMSTPPVNNAALNTGPPTAVNNATKTGIPGPNAGSTAIIYPWMKRVHSKGESSLFSSF